MRPLAGRRKHQRGNAMIEFALAFLFLWPLFYGTFQFGYGFFMYNTLRNAIREGARYAAGKTYDTSTSSYTQAWGDQVKNMVVYGNPAGTGIPVVAGLQPANINLAVVFLNNVPDRVNVRIQNFDLNALFRTYRLNSPSASFPYFGRYAPDGL